MNDVKDLFYLDWKFRTYKASTFANGLIYFLGRIPFIGKIIPTTMLYREYALKKVIATIQLIFSIIVSLLFESLPFLISYFISMILSKFYAGHITIFFIWLLLFNFLGTGFEVLFNHLSIKEIAFIRNFHISKREYLKKKFALNLILKPLYLLPGLLVLGMIEKEVILYVLLGIFSVTFMALFWVNIDLRVMLLKGRFLIKLLLISLFLLTILISGYSLLTNGQLVLAQSKLINWMSAFFCLAMWLPAIYFCSKFKHFDAYVGQVFHSSETKINLSAKEQATQEKYLGEGKKVKLEKGKNEEFIGHKKGVNYLNTLLFSRFKTSLRKQLILRLAIISLIMATIVILTFIFPIHMSARKLETILYNFIPSMFFVLFILSFGKKVTQTLFINCDSAMLSYPFYREPKPIIRGFFYRFFKIFYYNGLIGLTVFIWVSIFNASNHFPLSLSFMLLLVFVILSLTILFSFHELFIYYILQPFTSDLEVKNPMYKFVDGLFYMLAYLSLQLRTGGFVYAIVISTFSLVYFIVGIFIIIKFAPKTFKLKN